MSGDDDNGLSVVPVGNSTDNANVRHLIDQSVVKYQVFSFFRGH